MYPQLFNQASRMAPLLQRLVQGGASRAFSPLGRAGQIDIPEPTGPATPMQKPPPGPSAPISGDNTGDPTYSAGGSPLDRLKDAFSQFGAPAQEPQAMEDMQWPFGPMGAPSAEATVTPLPRARPEEAPQPPEDTGFFMRNALMQQDPMGGGFIDPTGAASVRGPDLISKMMGYLNRKVT